MNDGKYFFTTPATIKSSSSKKYKTYEVTGYSIEVDEKGHPTQNGFDQTAALMKLYCDTDYESARYLFIDKNGKIIRHLAYSNGVPNSTRPYPGEKELNEIRSYAQRNDCSIVFLHNHPNGYVEPSRADIQMTERMESLLADNSGTRRFAGHIILDTGSGTYGFYDSNIKNWEIRYDGQNHSFDEYYSDIKSEKLKINHDSDPDRKTIFFRIEDDRTPKFLSEIEKAYSKDEWNRDEWIPLFYLKEYGVLEHLEYIHKNSFKDYESLDKRIRSTATKTGTTRCFMLPKNYELTVECSRYASKKEQGKDKGIIESVYFANGSDSFLKRYKHSIFDGYNTDRMKIIDDSLDFPFGINMKENITKEKDIKSENIITADILQMIASKTTIWGISQQKAESFVNFLSENNISLYYNPDSLNISASGSLSGTQLENKEIITLKDIESFYSNKSVQFQTLKGEPNMKENIEKESVRQNDAGLKASSISGTGSSEMDYRVALAHEIKINMPNLTDGERAAAISILEAGAVSMDMKLSDYVKQTFPNGIFGNFQEAELSARQQGKLINGGVVIDGFGENAKAVIYASRTADFSTWVHEVAHIWQAQLTGKLKQNAEKAFNVENGDWKNSKYVFADGHEDTCGEAFAYGFEDILKNADSEFNTPEKQKIYKKFASYMSRTYNGLEKNIEINDDIKKVYDAFCLVDDNLLSQAEKAVKLEMNYEPAVTTEHEFDSKQMELQYQIVGENSIRSMSKSMERNRILSTLTAAVYLDENLKNLSDASKASRIRIETGWEKDKTGKWKYETDDSVSRIKNGSSFEKLISTNPKLLTKLTEGDNKLTLNDILDSPELFSIFPFMKDINIRFYDDPDTYRALLDSDGILINTHYLDAVNGEKGLKGILAHEIQHIIQAAEYNQKQDMTGENLELLYMNTMQKMREEGKRFYDYDTNSVDFGIEKYMKDAGEIEARNVARRIAFSDSERRHKTLRSTEEMMNKMQFQEINNNIATVFFDERYQKINIYFPQKISEDKKEYLKNNGWGFNKKNKTFYPKTIEAGLNSKIFIEDFVRTFNINCNDFSNIRIPDYNKKLTSDELNIINQNIENKKNIFNEISDILKSGVSVRKFNPNKDVNEIEFRRGEFKHNGVIHIALRRYNERTNENNLFPRKETVSTISTEEIHEALQNTTALLFLISNSLDTFKAEPSDGRNWYIHGNGLEITLRKDKYSKFVVTGYTNDIFIDKQNTEATETINAVIAKYGYTQEFLDLYTLVGAELASVYPNIALQIQSVNEYYKNHNKYIPNIDIKTNIQFQEIKQKTKENNIMSKKINSTISENAELNPNEYIFQNGKKADFFEQWQLYATSFEKEYITGDSVPFIYNYRTDEENKKLSELLEEIHKNYDSPELLPEAVVAFDDYRRFIDANHYNVEERTFDIELNNFNGGYEQWKKERNSNAIKSELDKNELAESEYENDRSNRIKESEKNEIDEDKKIKKIQEEKLKLLRTFAPSLEITFKDGTTRYEFKNITENKSDEMEVIIWVDKNGNPFEPSKEKLNELSLEKPERYKDFSGKVPGHENDHSSMKEYVLPENFDINNIKQIHDFISKGIEDNKIDLNDAAKRLSKAANKNLTPSQVCSKFIEDLKQSKVLQNNGELRFTDFNTLVKDTREHYTDEQQETLSSFILSYTDSTTEEEALKKLEKKIDTEIAIDNGADWEYDENNNKVLKNDSGYHVSYDDKGNVKDVRYDDLGEDIIHTLASVPYNKNESFREFFDRVTNERYSAEEKEQLDSILEKITGVSGTLEPQERVTQIFKNLEDEINGRKFGPEINGDLLTKSFEQLTDKYNSDDIHPAQKELFRKYFDEKIQEELGNKIHEEKQSSDELAKIVQTRFISDDISNRILNGKPLEGKDGDQQIALNSIDDVVKYIQSDPQRFERSEWVYGKDTDKIKQADKERSVEKQKTNYVLDKLAAAGIEVVTDKEEFDRILERENLLQKMQGTLTSEEYRRYFKFNEEDVKRFFEQVIEWQKDNSNPGKLIIVGKAPAIMKVLGISEHFIEVEQSTLDKMVRPEPVYPTDKDGHNLTISDIYDIPLQLADPVMVFKSRTRPEDSYVFFTERKDYLNRAILIPLAIDIKKGRIVIHEITSMYGRREEIEFVKSNIEQDNLIYADKDRYEKWADEKLKELQGQKKSNGERVSQIQFLGQRFTDIGTNLNILTKERLVNFISSQNQTKKQNYVLDNQTYGFAYEGKIYLNPEIWNSEVAVHEYTHLWDNYTQKTNPELWEKGKSIFKNTKFWEEVKTDPNYADIADNDDLLLSEVHSRICGKMADKILSRIAEQDGKLTQKTVIDWNKETWNYICEEMMEGQAVNYENGLTSKDLSDFLAMPVKDLVHGKKIIQEYDINKLNQKETKETVSERIARWDYNHDDGDQSWPEYSEVYFDKNNNEFILKQYEGYDDTWDERKITPEELLEEYNDAKRLNGYKNHKIIQELNENFVKSFITQEKQNIPSISDVEKEVVSDPEPSSHSDANFFDELKFTKTPEFEKPAEDIQVEDFDSNSSKTDPEKEEPVINKRQLSYSDFLIEASKLETPEAYEKFFNENFNFQIANFKPIPPIADNKLQLFIDGKATDKVFNDNIEEKRSWARWCFDKGMAMYVPLPEVVKKNGMEVIKKSISICNNLLNTDITREAEAKEQSQEAAEQKKDNEPGASIIGPQLYAGSEWTEEELKLIRHVEINKIPAFIKDPYMDDIAVPKFTTAFRDPETGEYTMKEQSGWHFAQKMTEHGAVTAIMLTKINDSGVREFLKIEPTQYEAIINRGKELVQEWSEPRFKNTHLQALYKYENDIGISKHETRINTCGQYFHNFEALCRGSSDGRPPADNEEQAMKYAKEIYMKMSPHEKRRMHKMEKEFLKVKGYTIEEELMRRFYEVQKERVFSKKELELPGHSDESLVNGINVEDGKIRGELDDVSHTKVGDTVRISLTTKNFNGKELRMPVTDMKVVAANKETNTVCLIDEQKNTRYELPLDKFISHRQEVTRKLNMQQQKDNRQAAKIEARQKKKETEDYSFGI